MRASFNEEIQRAASGKKTRTVLALDLDDRDPSRLALKSRTILEEVADYICAVKINVPLVLSLGLKGGVDHIVDLAHRLSIPAIMDAKLNDVGHTNESVARHYFDIGFDAIIASPVVGWQDGLDSVFRLAGSMGRAVLLLVHMSNLGADELYTLHVPTTESSGHPLFELFAKRAVEWGANGIIVGATKPSVIARVRALVGSRFAIYSPGVVIQGGRAKEALEAGSDYLIIGRSICESTDPREAALSFRDLSQ